MGIEQFTDVTIKLRARIKTRPMRQWDVAREFNRRLQCAFNEKGIEVALPERIVHHRWEQPPAGDAPPVPAAQLATD
jgi:small conductance mechanosensitive channel